MRKMANRLLLCSAVALTFSLASTAHASSGKPVAFVDLVQAFIELFTGPGVGERVSTVAQDGPSNASTSEWGGV